MKKERKRRDTSVLALLLAAAILTGDPVSALADAPPGAGQAEVQESIVGTEKGSENNPAAEEENRKEPSGSAAEGAQGSSAAGGDQAKEPAEPGESGGSAKPTEPETPPEPTAPTESEESEEPEESGEAGDGREEADTEGEDTGNGNTGQDMGNPEEEDSLEGDAEKEEDADKVQAPMLLAEGEQQTEKFIISTDNEGAKKEIEPIESVDASTTYNEGQADYKENRIYIRYQFDGDQSITTRKLSVNLEGGFQITSPTAVSSGIIDSVTVSQDKETMELVLSPALEQREGQVVLFNFSIQIPDGEYAREKELAGYMAEKGGIYDGIKVTEYCNGTVVSSSSSALNVSYSQWSDHDVLNTQKDASVWYPGINCSEARYGYRPSWMDSDPTISDWFYGGMALITDAETVESKAEEENPGQWQKKEGVYYVSTKNGHLLTRYAEEIEVEVPLPNGVEFVSANEIKNKENGTTVEKVEDKTGYIKVTQKAKAGEALGDKPIELWMTLDYTGVPDDSLDQARGIEKYGVQGWHNFFANQGDGWTNGPAGREETDRPWSIRAKIFGAWKEKISFYDRSALVTTTQSRAAASRSYTYMEDIQKYYNVSHRDRDTYYLWGYEAVSPSNTSLSKLQAKTIWDFPDTIQLVSISGGTSSITNAYIDNEGNSYASISSIPSGNWVKTMDKNRASGVTFSMKAKHSDGTEVSDGTVSSVKVTTEIEGYGLLYPKSENNGIQATYKKPQINSTTTYLDSGVHAFGKISYRSTKSNGLYKYPVNATLDVPTSDYPVLTVYSGNTYTTRSTNTSTGTIQEKIYRGYEMEDVTATLGGKSETGEESVFWDIFAQATGGQELESYFYVQFGTELPEEKKKIPKDAYLVCDIIDKEGKKRTEEIQIAEKPETSGDAVKLPLEAIAMGAGEWLDSITLRVPRLAESTMISWHLNSIELSTQKELPKGGEMIDYMDILTEGDLTNVRRKGSPAGSAYAKYEWTQSDESGSKKSIQKSQKVSSTSVFGVNWWTPMGDFSRRASVVSPSPTTPDEKIKMQVSIGGNGVNPTYVFEIAPEFYYEPESFEVMSVTRMDDLSEKDYRIRERWLPGKGTDGNHLLIISFEGESADTALNLYPITSTAVGGVNDSVATALLIAEITLNCDPLLEEGEYQPIKEIYRFDDWAENYLIDNNHATLDVSESSPVYCYWYRGEGSSVSRHAHNKTKLKKTRLYMERIDFPPSVSRKQDTNDLDQDGDTMK